MKALESPIVVIGAARSGTKLLRNLIASHPDLHAVPYDVNFIWRMGTESVSHDELRADDATGAVASHIRRQLARFALPGTRLVEKTVSNSLRVSFVNRVLPDARFVHLLRDGRDVVASAFGQWQAPIDWRYLLGKALRYPFLSAPGYAVRWGSARLFRRSRLPAVWGPAYAGIQDDLGKCPLLQVCARQWERSVESALDQLTEIPKERVLTVEYERLVSTPGSELARVLEFIGVDDAQVHGVAPSVTTAYLGTYKEKLSAEELSNLETWLGPTLRRVARSSVPPGR